MKASMRTRVMSRQYDARGVVKREREIILQRFDVHGKVPDVAVRLAYSDGFGYAVPVDDDSAITGFPKIIYTPTITSGVSKEFSVAHQSFQNVLMRLGYLTRAQVANYQRVRERTKLEEAKTRQSVDDLETLRLILSAGSLTHKQITDEFAIYQDRYARKWNELSAAARACE